MLTRLHPAFSLLGIGWYFALSIIGGVLLGVRVDGWLDTGKLFTVLGLFAGLGVAFWGGYKLLKRVTSRNQEHGVDEA